MGFTCRSIRLGFIGFLLLALFLNGFLNVKPVSAATIVVTTTDDEDVANTQCSLREAIKAANDDSVYNGCPAGSGADTITLSADTYTLTSGNPLPSITTEITINGVSSTATIIEADECNPVQDTCSHLHNIFNIDSGDSYYGELTLNNLTVRHGRFVISAAYGGAIYNEAAVNISHCLFIDNLAQKGGAIQNNFNGDVDIYYSTFSGNQGSSSNLAGAIYSAGYMNIENSTFSENEAGCGGAIHNAGDLTITNSTLSANVATKSTASHGGGLDNSGTATITNSTFSGNTALNGGGIYTAEYFSLNYTNTIIANSISNTDCANDGTIGTNINNLVEDGSCDADLTGDPLLGALSDNGGPTQTHALLEGSPAIDAGDLAACPGIDQRGAIRPQGPGCDIGAFELEFEIEFNLVFMPLLVK